MNTSKRHNRKRRLQTNSGFSLLELLIVLVIIGILAGIAVPRYMASTVKAKQTEAKEMLHEIFLMQRSFYHNNDRYWVPSGTTIATKDNPYALDSLGVEIMPSARYEYTITGDLDHFVATATARRLDDDPAIDRWEINERGQLRAVVDDAIAR